jgi:hypothetical protein
MVAGRVSAHPGWADYLAAAFCATIGENEWRYPALTPGGLDIFACSELSGGELGGS